MVDAQEQPRTTSPSSAASTEPAGGIPHVQVYDTTRTSAPGVTPPYGAPNTDDIGAARPGMNWGAIIVGILVVLALIYIVMWLF
jgi:hypothetical protein